MTLVGGASLKVDRLCGWEGGEEAVGKPRAEGFWGGSMRWRPRWAGKEGGHKSEHHAGHSLRSPPQPGIATATTEDEGTFSR